MEFDWTQSSPPLDPLQRSVRRFTAEVEAISRSRDLLTRRLFRDAFAVWIVIAALAGLAMLHVSSNTRLGESIPLLTLWPISGVVAMLMHRYRPSRRNWGWWSVWTLVLLLANVAYFKTVGPLILCLVMVWHVVNPPRTALIISGIGFGGLVGVVTASAGDFDPEAAIRLAAAYPMLTVMMQVVMRQFAVVSASAAVLSWDAISAAERLGIRIEQARVDVSVDPTTGVLTPAGFEQRLRERVSARFASDPPLAGRDNVLALHFRRWSEVYLALSPTERHQLSLAVGDRLRKVFGTEVIIGRMGAGDFAIVVAQRIQVDEDERLLSSNLQELARPVSVASRHVLLQPVLGVCRAPDDRLPVLERVRCAEVARDVAIRHRIDRRPVFFDPTMREEAAERVALAARIEVGLRAGEFALYHQPIVDITTGRCRKTEALLRWHHPERGVLAPGAFLGVAEEHGLSALLLDWTVVRACEDLIHLRDTLDAGFRVALNVSPELLVGGPDGVGRMEHQLAQFKLPKDALVLEITESALTSPSVELIAILHQLRAVGVLIAIDDFGTGYSTLARLAELPIDILKVDRLLVTAVDRRERQQTILRSIIAMAQGLGMQVTVEGVETEGEAAVVHGAGCLEIQGFLYSPAVPLDQLPAVLSRIEERNGASVSG